MHEEKWQTTSDAGAPVSYILRAMPAGQAFDVQRRLASILTPAIAVLFQDDGDGKEINPAAFAQLGRQVAQLDLELVKEIVAGHTRTEEGDGANLRNGDPSAVFDFAFRQNFGELYALVGKVLALNYGSIIRRFTGALPDDMAGLVAQIKASLGKSGTR